MYIGVFIDSVLCSALERCALRSQLVRAAVTQRISVLLIDQALCSPLEHCALRSHLVRDADAQLRVD